MKLRHLVLLVLTAAFCFGGTFNCHSKTDDTETTVTTG
jgi:hypothetical protein